MGLMSIVDAITRSSLFSSSPSQVETGPYSSWRHVIRSLPLNFIRIIKGPSNLAQHLL